MKETQKKRNTIYNGSFLNVHVDDIECAGGDAAQRVVVEHVGGAAMLPLRSDGSVVLVRQYRYAIGKETLEIPAGKFDVPGEDGMTCAVRECEEETGHTGKDIVKMGEIYMSPGFCTEKIEIFCMHDARAMRKQPEASDDVKTVILPLVEAKEMALTGKIDDAKTVFALLAI